MRRHMETTENTAATPPQLTAIEALAKHLDCKPDEITELKYNHYNLEQYEYEGCKYAIGTDSECDEACKTNLLDTLWAFNADFIASHTAEGLED